MFFFHKNHFKEGKNQVHFLMFSMAMAQEDNASLFAFKEGDYQVPSCLLQSDAKILKIFSKNFFGTGTNVVIRICKVSSLSLNMILIFNFTTFPCYFDMRAYNDRISSSTYSK